MFIYHILRETLAWSEILSKEMTLKTPVCQYIDEWLLIYSAATGHLDGSARHVGLLL